ncbi:MAG: hypothetical protein ACLP5V_16075 [Candidatus Bathyarchaeia archaeon]
MLRCYATNDNDALPHLHGRKIHVSVNFGYAIDSSYTHISGSICVYLMSDLDNGIHCQHEYADDNAWKCGKCGYQILPDLAGKIAETGSGRIMSTNV